MIHEIDCRGMACPAPVLRVRDVLNDGGAAFIAVLVDSDAARQNVSRFLEHNNYQVTYEIQGDEFRVAGTRQDGAGATVATTSATVAKERPVRTKKIMVLITSAHMGHGDDDLGDMLQFNFLKTLKEMGPDLWRIAFVNSGVMFTVEGSDAVPYLQDLAANGVQILACGACLAYFHILDKIQVGDVSNMFDIVTGMKLADSVVTV
ncbi:MAG: sulfurtransferase-like selenium metabolism protein YedF [Desulfuromonadaceae bacterium]|nr:sulfurtransferase-like selenium metabolism protein YedF [Desulfuromonadaceae bacterium]MDD2849590.1 sulfurtransferase-like selenium metabolism protein YedF [Desulfuromonadaceae bacterium]MDD4130951.1 sulfurtransferase-like selenium metabolism protein YedF [Desulfuromonadaceae bacterium]